MNQRMARNPRPTHRRINSDPLGGEGEADLDNPALTTLLEFDPGELFPLVRPTSFDEETEKQLLDCGEYYSPSPRSRPDSGNFGQLIPSRPDSGQFAAMLDSVFPPSPPFGSPAVTRAHDDAMQIDAAPPPYAAKAAAKKGHRRTASEPFFFGGAAEAVFAAPPQDRPYAPQSRRDEPPPPPPLQQPSPPRPFPPRPPLQTIPSARDLPFADAGLSSMPSFGEERASSLNFNTTPRYDLVQPPQPMLPLQPPVVAATLAPPPPAVLAPPAQKNGSSNNKKETKTYKCSRCGQIKANHVCRAVLYDSVAIGVQADPTKLVQTYGERTIVVRPRGHIQQTPPADD
mmetsp:Transcript_15569/g.48697  ORF Transcript_15569/g.48697 Transcript_15569/m.48697 type:complete len:343 (-) Transcript_15569:597-1625(-)